MRHPAAAAAALACLAAAAAASPGGRGQVTGVGAMFGKAYQGDATYYNYNATAAGACSFQYAGVGNEAWHHGVAYRAAMNLPQWAGSQVCGMCLRFKGAGNGAVGAGANPVGNQTRYLLISDMCPKCKAGDIDQEIDGDGRWLAYWTPVQCDVGASPFVYSFQGSNKWWLKLQVANHRVPVATVYWYARGGWYPMSRSSDNYFIFKSPDGQELPLPGRVRVASVFGDVVYDTVALSAPVGRVSGAVQFPYYASVGAVKPLAGSAAAVAGAPPPPEAPRPRGPLPGDRDGGGLPDDMDSPDFDAAAHAAAAAGAAAVGASPAGAPVRAAPPNLTVPALPDPWRTLYPYGVLQWPAGWGGLGSNGSDQLGGPRPTWPGLQQPGTNDSVGVPGPDPGWWPGPPGLEYPAANNDQLAAEQECVGGVDLGGQCGGSGGACAGRHCGDRRWPGLCCLDPGSRCVRYDAIFWECRLAPYPLGSGVEAT